MAVMIALEEGMSRVIRSGACCPAALVREGARAMAGDVDAVKAEAVSRLRAALLSGEAVSDAVRWACYRNPVFTVTLFAAAVDRRFGPRPDADEISAFVRRAGWAAGGDASAGFPAHEAELLIRMSLGELGLVSDIDAGLNHTEIVVTVLDRLFAEWSIGPYEVQELFAQAMTAADFAEDVDPDVAQADRSWFAAGMHASSFAHPLERAVPGAPGGHPDVAPGPPDQGQLAAEIAASTQVLDSDPQAWWALCRRAHAYRAMGRYDEALADCSRRLEHNPLAPWAIGVRGEIYSLLGRHEEALADFSRGVELHPSAAWALAGRARALQDLGRHEEAAVAYGQALVLNPDADWALGSRGECHLQLRQCEDAVADFTRAIEMRPDWTWAINYRGEAHRLAEHEDDALADFSRAIELEPSAWTLARRADLNRCAGRFEKALADFNAALSLEPADAFALLGRGQTLTFFGRHEEALADFDRAVNLEPSHHSIVSAAPGLSCSSTGTRKP